MTRHDPIFRTRPWLLAHVGLALLVVLPSATGAQPVREEQSAAPTQESKQEVALDAARVRELEQTGAAEMGRMPESQSEREAEARQLLQAAARAEVAGDLDEAIRKYGAVGSLAKAGVEGEVEARYALQFASLMARKGARPEALYHQAMEKGTPRQSALARNNLANLHLERGDAAKAVELFRELDLEAVEPDRRFVYRFNAARALESAGQGDEAYRHYLHALKEQPAFIPAVEGAWRAARTAAADDTELTRRAVEMGEHLLEAGQLRSFDRMVWSALEETGAPEVLNLFVRRWAIKLPERGELDERTWRRLAASVGFRPDTGKLIRVLQQALASRPFARAAESGSEALLDLSRRFEPWRDVDGGRAMANLLVQLAAADRERGADASALGRTFVAWWLDRDNTRAAVDCAAALRARPELDPEGRIQEELIQDLFEVKGRAYAARDFRNILRLHLLLASIFEKREQWGSSGEARSVIFQLEHALRAERELNALDSDYTPSVGLHRRLAEAYEAVGRRPKAFDHYLRAARSLAKLERVIDAERMVQVAEALTVPMDERRTEQLAETAAQIREQRRVFEERYGKPPG